MGFSIIFFILILLGSIILGAQILIQYANKKNEQQLSILISVSAGILLAITFHEFLPKSFNHSDNEQPALLILLGILCFIICDQYITPKLNFFNNAPSCKRTGCETHDPKKLLSQQTACTSISCLVVCSFFDGIELGTGFLTNDQTGFILAFALYLHIAPAGALAASLSLAGQLGPQRAFKSAFIVAGALTLGLSMSFLISTYIGFIDYLLPFATGVMIYNLFAHLIPATLKLRWGLITLILSTAIAMTALHLH